ncbi:MAG: sigma 54-interacting transcriptional regulator [Gemmatimonadetes bacterium]|nr:sigma 54-interacting transcriptional regulator [Gemmatimonadota bacterium]MBT7864125.1 sigma 54-interacting transcriptional regulator [Gemmatimonadota bacterium]
MRILILVLLAVVALSLPLYAHNGAVAIAVPVEGIVVDGDLSDWPEGMRSYEVTMGVGSLPQAGSTGRFQVGYEVATGHLVVGIEARRPIIDDSYDLCRIQARGHGSNRQDDIVVRIDDHSPVSDNTALRNEGWGTTYEVRLDLSTHADIAPGTTVALDVALRSRDGWVSWAAGIYGLLGDALLVPSSSATQRVVGAVLRDDGRPAPRHLLSFRSDDWEGAEIRVVTDRDGVYGLELPVGEYTVVSADSAASVDVIHARVVPGEAVQLPDLRLSQPQADIVVARADDERRVQTKVFAGGAGVRRHEWQTISIADGLAGSTVLAIHQDRKGAMWFGTQDGVTYWDGHDMFRLGPGDGLHHLVTALEEDPAGGMWFGTSAGLYLYRDGVLRSYSTQGGLIGDLVTSLFVDGDGQLWIGTSAGISCYYEGKFRNYKPTNNTDGNSVTAIAANGNGDLWFGTVAGASVFDGTYFTNYTRADGLGTGVTGIVEGHDDDLWLSTLYEGIVRFDGDQFLPLATVPTALSSVDMIRALMRDRLGGIWAATPNGLWHFAEDRWSLYTEEDGLPSSQTSAVLEDKSGQIWCGTGWHYLNDTVAGGGVARMSPGEWTNFSVGDGLLSNGVMTAAEDSQGRLWVGNWKGVNWFDGEAVHALPEVTRNVWAIAEDHDGNIWLGSYGGGVYRYDGISVVRFTEADGLAGNRIPSVVVDREGAVWFGCVGSGVTRYRAGIFTSFSPEHVDPQFAADIALDADGQLVVAAGTRVLRFDGSSFTAMPPISSTGSIGSMVFDQHGSLWVGIWQGTSGVQRYDGQQWVDMTVELESRDVWDLMVSDDGHLWVSAYGSGVRRYDGTVVQSLLTRDGLGHDGVHQVIQSRQGDYWIAHEGGVSRFQPPVALFSARISQVVTDQMHGPAKQISMTTEQDFVNISFHAADLRTRPSQMVYRHRLVGVEDEWQQGRERRVVYRDLPAGNYTFEVHAVNRDLVYSEPATLRVLVRPAYGQIVLRVGLVLALVGAVMAARFGIHRRQERDLARTELVAERRQRIEVQPHEIEFWTVDNFVGSSASMQSILSDIGGYQQEDSRILITGEVGTGKELVARAIHAGSGRSGHAFVPVRCAGLPKQVESLSERTELLSILFGHAKGAFPGADEDRPGIVQQARDGTLFFDEVGLLPLPVQAHLLRVLAQGEVRRTGASEAEPVDVRVLAASSEDLLLQVELGAFSKELYDFLSARHVAMPPLRERDEDIAPLAQQIVDRLSAELKIEKKPVSADVVEELQGYDYPGNVRQLHRILEQALGTTDGEIRLENLKPKS